MTDKRFRILIGYAFYVTIGYVTPDDIAIGVRLRSLVDLSDVPAGTIGIVEQIAHQPWRFFLRWPMGGHYRYSLSFHADDLRHLALMTEPITETQCSTINNALRPMKQPRRSYASDAQLSLPLSDWEI